MAKHKLLKDLSPKTVNRMRHRERELVTQGFRDRDARMDKLAREFRVHADTARLAIAEPLQMKLL